MTRLSRILCLFGLHRWRAYGAQLDECGRCHRLRLALLILTLALLPGTW
jgi:hypothetical protein